MAFSLVMVIASLVWSTAAAAAVVSNHGSTGGVSEHVAPFPLLAPLLIMNNGTRVTTATQWHRSRRPEVGELVADAILGRWPREHERPVYSSAATTRINTTTYASGATASFYNVTYKTRNLTTPLFTFQVEVLAPRPRQGESFPLFITMWNHRNWALLGLARGYVSVIYPGADLRDVAPAIQELIPEATMMLIKARALVASLTLDFALDTDGVVSGMPNITASHVCITGHSRNGKQSLIAAAFDERITAVVGSSPGAPIASPYSYSTHNFYGEPPDSGMAGFWWLSSVANYSAHPETLPMDGHGILAMIAPRHCAIADAWTDHEGDLMFANEYGIAAAATVYALYEHDDERLQIIRRPGDHHGFISVDSYFDYFDYAFKLTKAPIFATIPDTDPFGKMTYMTPAGFDWDVWERAYAKTTPHAPGAEAPLTDRISWLLQNKEPTVRGLPEPYAEDAAGRLSYLAVMMQWDGVEGDTIPTNVSRRPVSFGQYVTGEVYWPTNYTGPPLPVVVWLHPYSYSTGFAPTYADTFLPNELVAAGFMVLAYDQVGFATRIREGGTNFYRRHGDTSSLFGHAVADAHAAVDFLSCLTPRRRYSRECATGEVFDPRWPNFVLTIPDVDSKNIMMAGYSFGGNVALHAAATDKRITAIASFAGFTPMRTDTNDRRTAGIRRLYDVHALLPRLGLFANDTTSIPYDYDELIASLAPRPTLIYTFMQDRDATFEDVVECVDIARVAWGDDGDGFNHTVVDNYTIMWGNETQTLVDWATDAVAK